jgi:hypothetical protein
VGVSVPATASSGQAANLTLDHMTRSIPHHATRRKPPRKTEIIGQFAAGPILPILQTMFWWLAALELSPGTEWHKCHGCRMLLLPCCRVASTM